MKTPLRAFSGTSGNSENALGQRKFQVKCSRKWRYVVAEDKTSTTPGREFSCHPESDASADIGFGREKGLEEMIAHFARNARPIVQNSKTANLSLRKDFDHNLSYAFGYGIAGVVQKIDQDLGYILFRSAGLRRTLLDCSDPASLGCTSCCE